MDRTGSSPPVPPHAGGDLRPRAIGRPDRVDELGFELPLAAPVETMYGAH